MEKIQREDTSVVRGILESGKTIDEKANEIYQYNEMVERSATNWRVCYVMSVQKIRDILIERER